MNSAKMKNPPSFHAIDLYRMGAEEYETGILPVAIPTGKGKTHDMIEFVLQTSDSRKSLIIIPQWKNMDQDTLRKQAKKQGKSVCIVESCINCVRNYWETGKWESIKKGIQDLEFPEKQEKALLNRLNHLEKALKNHYPEEELAQREYGFRSQLLKFWRNKWEKEAEREAMLKKQCWLMELYPYVLAKDADIVVVTAARYVLPFNDFIGASHPFYSQPCFQNCQIFLDESPEIYQFWLDHFCNMPVGIDLIKIFEIVRNTLQSSLWDNPREHRDQEKIRKLKARTEELYRKYNVIRKLKRKDGETIEISFSNGTFIENEFYPQGNGNEARIYYWQKDRFQNWITTKKEGALCSLKEAIHDFYSWWSYLLNIIRDLARERMEITGHDFPSEVGTVMDDFNIPDLIRTEETNEEGAVMNLRNLIREQISVPFPKYTFATPDEEYDPTPFANGFRLFKLIDYEDRDNRTMIDCRVLFCMPEYILGEASRTSLVFLISATAEFNSPYHNFNWDYLQNYYTVLPKPGPFRKRFQTAQKQFLEEDAELFSQGKVTVEFLPENKGEQSEILPNQIIDSEGSLRNLHELNLLPGPCYDNKIVKTLETAFPKPEEKKKDQYLYQRNVKFRLVRAFARFYNGPEDLRSAVLFSMRSGADQKDVLTDCILAILEESPNLPEKYLFRTDEESGERIQLEPEEFKKNLRDHISDFAIFVKGTKDYQEKIDQAKKQWSQGMRTALFVSAKTAGTSVNLDYVIPEELIRTVVQVRRETYPDENGKLHKDFDFLYLDRLTNLIPQYDPNNLSSKEENQKYMEFCAILESLGYQQELTTREARNLRRKYFGGWHKEQFGKTEEESLRNQLAFRLAYTEQFIQILGRMTRTAFRGPDSVIVLDEAIVQHLEYEETRHYSLGALSRYVLQKCEEQKDRSPEPVPALKRERTVCQYDTANIKSIQVAQRRRRLQNGIRYEEYREEIKQDHIRTYDTMIYNPDVLFYDYSRLQSLDQLEEIFGPDIGRYARKFDVCERPYFESPEETTYWIVQNSQKNREQILDMEKISEICRYEDPCSYCRRQAEEEHDRSFIALDGTRGYFDLIMKNPDIRNHFEKHGWNTDPDRYGKGKYCLCLKEDQERIGKLGEEVTLVALTQILPYTLKPFRDLTNFEDFDFEIPDTSVAIDAKNWHNFSESWWTEHALTHVVEKAIRNHKQHILILNVYRETDHRPHLQRFRDLNPKYWNGPDWDGDILFCPSLLNTDGTWNPENMDQVKEDLEKWIR